MSDKIHIFHQNISERDILNLIESFNDLIDEVEKLKKEVENVKRF